AERHICYLGHPPVTVGTERAVAAIKDRVGAPPGVEITARKDEFVDRSAKRKFGLGPESVERVRHICRKTAGKTRVEQLVFAKVCSPQSNHVAVAHILIL